MEVSEARLAAAEARLASLQAIFAAEQTRGDPVAYKQASKRAALLETEALKAAGEYESKAFATDAGKVKAARAKIAKAEKKLAETTGADRVTYTLPRVSRKALETPAHKEGQYPATYPDNQHGATARPGPLDDLAEEPAHRPGRRQPCLAPPLWRAAGGDGG